MAQDAILYWNEVCQQAHANDHTGTPPPQEQGGPAFSSRAFAIVHAAMYDTANSFYRTRTRYAVLGGGRKGEEITSVESAIAGAAFTTLLNLYKRQETYLENRLVAFRELLKEPIDILSPFNDEIFAKNLQVGIGIGDQITALRQNDRSAESRTLSPQNSEALFPNASDEVVLNRPNPNPNPTFPGICPHQPDPENPNQGLYAPRWGLVTPFVIQNLTTVILSAPFPPLNSQRYLQDFNEVKSKGVYNSAPRTADELRVGIYGHMTVRKGWEHLFVYTTRLLRMFREPLIFLKKRTLDTSYLSISPWLMPAFTPGLRNIHTIYVGRLLVFEMIVNTLIKLGNHWISTLK